MSGPDILRIKRKRTEPAPDALLIERPGKRQVTDIHYILRGKAGASHILFANNVQQSSDPHANQHFSTEGKPSDDGRELNGAAKERARERRTFHLKKPSSPESGGRKRKGRDDAVATFIEGQSAHDPSSIPVIAEGDGIQQEASNIIPASRALKRPSRNAAVKISGASSQVGAATPTKLDSNTARMAEYLHRFAIEESARENREDTPSKPKVTARPKLPPHRSRELHELRASQNKAAVQNDDRNGSMDLDEESDYVYDTYVIASSSSIGAAQVGSVDALGNVGYLVITEEDQAIWETYLEDEASDKDWNSDEEDENAEDWYGADYPDDELASDDEFGRDAYRYRDHGGSDYEEWDADTGHSSDGDIESDKQYWRGEMQRKVQKYFGSSR